MRAALPPIVSGNPRPLDTGNDYDRLQRYSRLVTGYACLTTVAFLAMTGFCWSLFPLKQIVPQFVYFSDAKEQVVSVDARHISRDTRDLLTEKLIREYIVDREMINNVDEKVRYKRVQRFSAPDIFEKFHNQMDPTSANSPLRKYREGGVTREIHIETVSPTSYTEGIYAVDYLTIDRKLDQEVARNSWRATVKVGFPPIETHPDIASENPIGLIVERYSLAGRDLSNNTKGSKP